MALIDELLPKAMADIGAIPKLQNNKFHKYNFRGVDDVLNAVNPILTRHGLSVSVEVRERHIERSETKDREGRVSVHHHCTLTLAVTFFASDGSSRTNVVPGEALDTNGDKATSKALSGAFKYAMFLGLVIPVDRQAIEDGDRENGESNQEPAGNQAPEARQEPPPLPGNGAARPASPPPREPGIPAYERGKRAIMQAADKLTVAKLVHYATTLKDNSDELTDDELNTLVALGNKRVEELEAATSQAAA